MIIKGGLFCLAILLILSFGVHTISFDHHHPGEFGDELHAYFHGEDKKIWAVLISVILLAAVIFLAVFNLDKFSFVEQVYTGYIFSKVFSPLLL